MPSTTSDAFMNLDPAAQARLARCQEILRELGRVIVAFSAGVDSTFLLALAVRTLGRENALGVTGLSASLAQRELEEAKELVSKIGADCEYIATGELDDPRYAANPANRCYFCKSDLFNRVLAIARDRGYEAVLSGANADDTGDFRPGMQAAKELGVRSPLLEAGLTKADIRAGSKALGLPTWDKPAMACLASRVAYGLPITIGKLGRIEQAEYVLKDLGFRQCRVRDHDTVARIEVPGDQIEQLLAHREKVLAALKGLGYKYVTLDLQGFRSGSMNESLP